eukprot:9040530-Pyramimonas_sp.AAC.1
MRVLLLCANPPAAPTPLISSHSCSCCTRARSRPVHKRSCARAPTRARVALVRGLALVLALL